MILNSQAEKFLKHFVDEKQKYETPRLKSLQRQGKSIDFAYSNNAIRSGGSTWLSRRAESNNNNNPVPLAGEKYSQMSECDKQKVRTIFRNLADTFRSSGSFTLV